MNTELQPEVEARVAELAHSGAVDAAVEEAIRTYGGEIYGFLAATLRDEAEADEVFALWSEDVWKGLGRFAWQSSLRTWLYVLARHASARLRRGTRRGMDALQGNSVIERAAAEVRTATQSFLRTDSRNRFAELRRALPEADQMLLVLRVNRGLEWRDIAQALLDEPEPDEGALRREAARLRKRFERLRAELIESGKRTGLLPQRT